MVGLLFAAIYMLNHMLLDPVQAPEPLPPASAHDVAARALRHSHAQKAPSLRQNPPGSCPRPGGCDLAKRESLYFFSDIVDEDWIRLKERYAVTPNHHFDNGRAALPHIWYQLNWEPSFTCQHEQRVGGTGDGPK